MQQLCEQLYLPAFSFSAKCSEFLLSLYSFQCPRMESLCLCLQAQSWPGSGTKEEFKESRLVAQ